MDNSLEIEARCYTRLFKDPFPGKKTGNIIDDVNPKSLEVFPKAWMPLEMISFLNTENRW